MNKNGKRNIKSIEKIYKLFKANNMLGEYDYETWKNFIKGNNLWGKFLLKKDENKKCNIRNSIKFELTRIMKDKQITENEYTKFLDEYCGETIEIPNLPVEISNPVEPVKPMESIMTTKENYSEYIPEKSDIFVEVGDLFKDIDNIVSNKIFFPMYIYGVSGIGKTFNVEQSCAKNKRPYFRVQITKDTTNEDLIGSYALINGNTVWKDGPVLKAYRSGGILLLDEVDLNPSLMILQGVLENKPVYVTQTGELVYPSEGFQVFATGNSKGDGTEYEYVGTSALNRAFLERFDWIIEQKIPTISSEKRIIKKYISVNKFSIDDNLLEYFYKWIDTVRKSFINGDTTIYISTRRVQSIIKGYVLTKNIEKAIINSMSHYDAEETSAFVNVWKAINGTENENENKSEEVQ